MVTYQAIVYLHAYNFNILSFYSLLKNYDISPLYSYPEKMHDDLDIIISLAVQLL